MFEIANIDHLVLRTDNIEKMLQFYTQVLGCHVERETPRETGLIQLRAGSSLIDLVATDSRLGRIGGGPPTKTENNMDHFCLQIKNISEEKLLDHLAKFGVDGGGFSSRYGAQGLGNSLYINDPDENIVELRIQL
ncbi:VOC family protein [Microbulbifer epialgicus]|uniref:VOC family protein n=1 Tax=Microbulbifer epialgicus TaxID=393907 RepID=A0ABV4P7W0_9GAMM